jgi:hypothetical protein
VAMPVQWVQEVLPILNAPIPALTHIRPRGIWRKRYDVRLSALEQKRQPDRTMHFVFAHSQAERDQRVAELYASGAVQSRDGLLTIVAARPEGLQ